MTERTELEQIKDAISAWMAARDQEMAAKNAVIGAREALEKALDYKDCSVFVCGIMFHFDEHGNIYSHQIPDFIIFIL